MSGGISRRQLLGSAAAVTAAGAFGLPAFVPSIAEAKLPDTMLWTAADVGSSGYAEASAIANALINNYGTRIRIVPSGTSIGRLLQLKTGRVQLAFLANEAYFGSEAIFDFSSPFMSIQRRHLSPFSLIPCSLRKVMQASSSPERPGM